MGLLDFIVWCLTGVKKYFMLLMLIVLGSRPLTRSAWRLLRHTLNLDASRYEMKVAAGSITPENPQKFITLALVACSPITM